jgi:hypothetical protein
LGAVDAVATGAAAADGRDDALGEGASAFGAAFAGVWREVPCDLGKCCEAVLSSFPVDLSRAPVFVTIECDCCLSLRCGLALVWVSKKTEHNGEGTHQRHF